MARCLLRHGQTIFSRDGKKLGRNDRLIMDDQSRRVEAVVVHKLLHSADKVIDLGLVDWTDENRVVLKIDATDCERLPTFFEENFVDVTPGAAQQSRRGVLLPGVPGPFLSDVAVAGRMSIRELTSGTFPNVIPSNVAVMTESNMPFEDDVISCGTEIVATDGNTVGRVSEVFVAPDASVSGFSVTAGHLFRHNSVVPIEWVGDIGEKSIRLKVTSDQARQAPPAPDIPQEILSTA